MEYQEIQITKCCHRLYSSLRQGTILDLVGEPWFRPTLDGIYFCSNTTINQTVSMCLFKKDESGEYDLSIYLEGEIFAPVTNFILSVTEDEKYQRLSDYEKEKVLCAKLGDFFRVHYKKFD